MANNKSRDLTEYKIEDAVAGLRKVSKEKFDATVELHINLGTDPKKQDQMVRFNVTPPHGTGKSKKVAVLASKKTAEADLNLSEADLDKIESGDLKPKTDFDVLVTEPKFMSKVAKVAKILGPLGMMPSPKTGTVTENPEEAVSLIKKGLLDIKTEKDIPVIHTILGKMSFEDKALIENYNEVMNSLRQNKPAKVKGEWIKSAYICTSMSPSVKIELA